MNNHKYILEPYSGMKSRYHCPNCRHRQKTFSRYISTETGEYISPDVGRCNRENNCGYHYTPKEYFENNNIDKNDRYAPVRTVRTVRTGTQNTRSTHSTHSTHGTQGTHQYAEIPVNIFERSLSGYDKNTFVKYLKSLFGYQTTNELVKKYKIGTSKHWKGSTIFYQIDIEHKVRAGKIMLYDKTGHRIKEPYSKITWIHKVIKIDNYELKQCLFGEHLIPDNDSPIAIVESEKTACIASIYLPSFLWLACGQLNGLNAEKCEVLKGKTVFLFPDLNGFDKWQKKANELQNELSGTRFIVSDYLQKNAPETDKGLDLADYLVRFDLREFTKPDKIEDYPPSWDDITPDYSDKWQLTNRLINEGMPQDAAERFAENKDIIVN